MPFKIAILGTGNVGYHLTRRLTEAGHPPATLISREAMRAIAISEELGIDTRATAATSIPGHDFVILAVPDEKIREVVRKYSFTEDTILLHTSGAQPLQVLGDHPDVGVLYPFQTFTREKRVNFDQVPLLLEANHPDIRNRIEQLAQLLGPKIHWVDSNQRLRIHLAAVFTSNFSNYLYHVADDILSDTGLGLRDLKHLMLETVEKAVDLSPAKAQTGPAIRGDHEVLARHRELLQKHPDVMKIYDLLSAEIASLKKQ